MTKNYIDIAKTYCAEKHANAEWLSSRDQWSKTWPLQKILKMKCLHF